MSITRRNFLRGAAGAAAVLAAPAGLMALEPVAAEVAIAKNPVVMGGNSGHFNPDGGKYPTGIGYGISGITYHNWNANSGTCAGVKRR